MAEKEEKKRIQKQKERDEDERFLNEFAKYRFGALNQGGGSPIRNASGEVVTEHIPFSSISQHNGGIELIRVESREAAQQNIQDHLQPNYSTLQPQSALQPYNTLNPPTNNAFTFEDQFQSSNIRNQMLGGQNLQNTMNGQANKSILAKTKDEIAHMKPSNLFDDITEDEFNRREQNKNAYKAQLMA